MTAKTRNGVAIGVSLAFVILAATFIYYTIALTGNRLVCEEIIAQRSKVLQPGPEIKAIMLMNCQEDPAGYANPE
jgi:hypothetical protein